MWMLKVYKTQKNVDSECEWCVVLCAIMCFLQKNTQVLGKNIDKNKVEVRNGIEHYFFNVLKKFYIAIWSFFEFK
jgi:hypothetical protein